MIGCEFSVKTSSCFEIKASAMKKKSWVSDIGRGVRDDFLSKIGLYVSDWTDALTPKVIASTFFIFFTSLAPAITFSLLLTKVTEDKIGAIEVLLSTSITGIFFALFGGQPLIIVGVTGPVAILTVNIYILAEQWGVNFLPLYAWSQIWAAIIMVSLALVNACDTLKFVTRFSCETFGILIALLYLYTGIEGIVKVLGSPNEDLGAALLQFIISIGTCWLAQVLSDARHWMVFNDRIREVIADYGATVSIVLWSVVPTMAGDRIAEGSIPKLFVPLTFTTTSGRPWLVDLLDLPPWAVFAAIFPGLIIAVLFFFDHNVSSLLAQDSEFKLRKGQSFHLDFLIIGLSVLMTGLLGIPPTNGLIPQAPLHAKSLMVMRRVVHTAEVPPDEEAEENKEGESQGHGATADADIGGGSARPAAAVVHVTHTYEISHVHEQRVSALLQSLMCGIVCFRPFSDALREIPTAVLYGIFLYLGTSSFEGNEFAYRVKMVYMEARLRQRMAHVYRCAQANYGALKRFTGLQALFCAIIFGITFTDGGVVFPVLIAALVGVREYLLPRWFDEGQLGFLDSAILPAKREEVGDELLGVDLELAEELDIAAGETAVVPLEGGFRLRRAESHDSADGSPRRRRTESHDSVGGTYHHRRPDSLSYAVAGIQLRHVESPEEE